jgi:ABC-type antimicrobial peptide transport system permease subunit
LLGRVLLRGMCMGWMGVAAGLLGAALLREWWLGTAITPQAFAGALLCMVLVTLGATAIPACRALAIPPWRILRGEV